MKLRYYAEADTAVDHRHTVELLDSIADRHAIPVEIVQVEPQRAPPEDIVGNVGIVVDGDLVWATRFWGTHHGWGPVDPEETAIGFLEAVESGGMSVIAERVLLGDWSPEDVETNGEENADANENEDAASTDAGNER